MNTQISPSKQRLLIAAAEVTQIDGAGNLTLDKVAERAGVSKGGLLYHYPSKRALLEGMLTHLLQTIESRVAEAIETDLGSYVEAMCTQPAAERAMAQALLAAAAEDPALLSPARELVSRWLGRTAELSKWGPLLLLANEGLRFLDLLDLLPSAADHARLRGLLLEAGEQLA
ncbi:MAG: TetR family transcriptional regulator [Pseudomonadota bacterium]